MKLAICDGRISEGGERALSDLGFRAVKLLPFPTLPSALASHTDILLFADGEEIICSEEYRRAEPKLTSELCCALPHIKFSFTNDRYGSEYPLDAIFNALVIGDKIFMRVESISEAIKAYAMRRGLRIIPVKQGYPACTVLPLGDRYAITSDRGMARALCECGIEVTLISDSEKILLPPHSFGFIGGCCGIYRGCVYFLGNLDAHPDADIIKGAIGMAGLSYSSLDPSAEGLFDLGGIRFYE